MIMKDINSSYILNLILNCIKKKGKNNISKKLILNSSINILKNCDYNFFNILIENLIKQSILPFNITKKGNKYKCTYIKQIRTISNIVIYLLKNIKKNNKRISFDFYFTNEIYKLLNKSNFVNITKQNNVKLFKNLVYNNLTLLTNLNNIRLKDLIETKTIIKNYWKYLKIKNKSFFYTEKNYKTKFYKYIEII